MKITSAEYIVSAVNKSQFPKDSLPEIAFAGRSNVGKSSLLNCLVGKSIAKTSGTPGKTRTINFFLMNGKFYYVDLPGYGYARVAKSMRKSWQDLMETYLTQRLNLKATVVIIDVRREEIPSSDMQMVDFLQSAQVPCIPVFTKADKLNRGALAQAVRLHKKQLPAQYEPILFSAVTKQGLQDLSRGIAGYIG